ncbi:alkaline phosphatase family protein [Microbulbifer variabilis]|uniref:alkaline phosphatase family protein n=1 Tax=Microbulbifer variabilis TaxID=266805 RepID=UPI001CFE09FC|nr:alkaline phosphatase family protein [Microbulbifer variabilis]
MDFPNPDPGETFPRVNTQLYGTTVPKSNHKAIDSDIKAPYNLLKTQPSQAPMNGFVEDYISVCRQVLNREPDYDDYKIIMQCFPPETVPVISTLAKSFAVCDHWFCDVPSGTWSNRSFFHAAGSGGLVLNTPTSKWLKVKQETVFNRMIKHGISWNIYHDKRDPFPLTELIHYPEIKGVFGQNVKNMEDFYHAVEQGKLPQYSFIEPRFFHDHNDQHPPIQTATAINGGPSSVLAGELLVHQVYDAIRRSDNLSGSNFQNTLLLITYDEHGGCYDHISPPSTVSPDWQHANHGEMGFAFNRLGLRVPAIVISAYIEPGTVFSYPLQHTSLLKTMELKWNLGHLTQRDRTAPSLKGIFNRSEPRAQDNWPVTKPRPVTRSTEENTNLHQPLNELQRIFVQHARHLKIGVTREAKEIGAMTVYEALVEFNEIKRDLGLLKK